MVVLAIVVPARSVIVLLALTDQVLLALSLSSALLLLQPCLLPLHLLHP